MPARHSRRRHPHLTPPSLLLRGSPGTHAEAAPPGRATAGRDSPDRTPPWSLPRDPRTRPPSAPTSLAPPPAALAIAGGGRRAGRDGGGAAAAALADRRRERERAACPRPRAPRAGARGRPAAPALRDRRPPWGPGRAAAAAEEKEEEKQPPPPPR